jgi:hypothetical protein
MMHLCHHTHYLSLPLEAPSPPLIAAGARAPTFIAPPLSSIVYQQNQPGPGDPAGGGPERCHTCHCLLAGL